jgi:hypothetical protein
MIDQMLELDDPQGRFVWKADQACDRAAAGRAEGAGALTMLAVPHQLPFDSPQTAARRRFAVKYYQMRLLVYTLAFCFMTSAASARGIVVYGVGLKPCGYWSSIPKRGAAHQQLSDWILGFVSAYNYYSADGRDVTSSDGRAFTEWMDRYCREHPHDLVAEAAHRLVDELVAKRTPLPSNENATPRE